MVSDLIATLQAQSPHMELTLLVIGCTPEDAHAAMGAYPKVRVLAFPFTDLPGERFTLPSLVVHEAAYYAPFGRDKVIIIHSTNELMRAAREYWGAAYGERRVQDVLSLSDEFPVGSLTLVGILVEPERSAGPEFLAAITPKVKPVEKRPEGSGTMDEVS